MQRKFASFKHILFPGTGCHVPHSLMVLKAINSIELKKSGTRPLSANSMNYLRLSR